MVLSSMPMLLGHWSYFTANKKQKLFQSSSADTVLDHIQKASSITTADIKSTNYRSSGPDWLLLCWLLALFFISVVLVQAKQTWKIHMS